MLSASLVADREQLRRARADVMERESGGIFARVNFTDPVQDDDDFHVQGTSADGPLATLVTLRRLADELALSIGVLDPQMGTSTTLDADEKVWFCAFDLGVAMGLKPKDAMGFAGAHAFGDLTWDAE